MSLSRFRNPYEVVHHPQLEPEVKRAILASWASDTHEARNSRRCAGRPNLTSHWGITT